MSDGNYYIESVRLLALARHSYADTLRALPDPRSLTEAISALMSLRDSAQGMAARAANLVDLLTLQLHDLQEGGQNGSDKQS